MAWESIELNICPTGDKPVFHAAQYDIGRPIIIALKNGEDDFTPTDIGIELQVRKVDNNVVTAVPDSVVGNVVTFLTTEQMTACSGTNLCELQLTSGDNTMATLHFFLVVQRDALQGGLSSQSEIHDLEEQIAAIVPEVIGDEYYTAAQVDELIDDIPTFDPSNYYDKTQLYTKTETNGLLAQKANVSSLATVATTGNYNDLSNKPAIPDVSNYYTKSETYSQGEVDTLLSTKADAADLAAVATSGDYDDLLNKPTIPDYATALPISSTDPTDTKSYIDNVVTSGSNANGVWIKYADGTMICTKTIEFSVATSEWQAWGSCYETALKDCGVWAMNFISSPIVSATQTGGAAWLEYFYDTDNTNVGKTRFVRPTVPGATAIYKMNVIGVGRWKA